MAATSVLLCEEQVTQSTLGQDAKITYTGMLNFGNMCYLNSLLQQLYWIPPFRKCILESPVESPVEEALKECFRSLGDSVPCSSESVLHAIGLESGCQRDVYQVFVLLTTHMKNHPALECLAGYVKHTLTYGAENQITTEIFHYITLEVLGNSSLQDALVEWNSIETIDGYYWNDKPVSVSKHSRVSTHPAILVFHLNRFTLNMNTWETDKLHTEFTFPIDLAMENMYSLRGVVVHCGEDANSGHYKSFVVVEEKKWIELDDEVATTWCIDERLKQDCFGSACLLIYEMKSIS